MAARSPESRTGPHGVSGKVKPVGVPPMGASATPKPAESPGAAPFIPARWEARRGGRVARFPKRSNAEFFVDRTLYLRSGVIVWPKRIEVSTHSL